jgi:hypothetical protein
MKKEINNAGNSAFLPASALPNSGYPNYTGGNSGAVVSPAPGLGLSSYQSPDNQIKKVKHGN